MVKGERGGKGRREERGRKRGPQPGIREVLGSVSGFFFFFHFFIKNMKDLKEKSKMKPSQNSSAGGWVRQVWMCFFLVS